MLEQRLEIYAEESRAPGMIYAVQGEAGSRKVRLVLPEVNSGDLPAQAGNKLYILKNDGNVVMINCERVTTGETAPAYECILPLQACTAAGLHRAALQVLGSGKDVRFDNIRLFIEPCDIEGAIASTTDLGPLGEILDKAGEATAAANAAAAEASALSVWEEYTNFKWYEKGNKVSYKGSSYVCLKTVSGFPPTNTNFWELIAAKGDTGNTGPQGEAGPQGIKGDTGERGPKGEKGDQGEQGDTGEQGPQGIQGIQGPKGDAGPKGDQGEKGEPGPRGPEGPQGEQGPRGIQGIQGPKGDMGPKGDPGPRGEPGPQGERGETGRGLDLRGQYDTLAALEAAVPSPAVGDAYSIGPSEPYDIYIFGEQDGENRWINNGKLQGAQGERGPKGETGPKGEKGDQGPEGPEGPQGQTGATGIQGPRGEKGEKGDQGAQGPKGEKGDPGPAGEKGIQGETGGMGPAGPPGAAAQINGVNILTLTVGAGLTGEQSGSEYAISAGEEVLLARGGSIAPSDWTERPAPAGNANSKTQGGSTVAFSEGKFIAMVEGGYIYSLDGGLSWTKAEIGDVTDIGYMPLCADGRFLAFSLTGSVSKSIDGGKTWSKAPQINAQGSAGAMTAAAYGEGRVVAIDGQGKIIYFSEDYGETWTSAAFGDVTSLYSIAYGGGRFAMTPSMGTGALVSANGGTSWTKKTTPVKGGGKNTVYGKGIFLALGRGNALYSEDGGETWKGETIPITQSGVLSVFDGRRFVGIGPRASGKSAVLYGEPGSWESAEIELPANPAGLAYGNGRYVLQLTDGKIFVSSSSDLKLITPGGVDMTELVRAALG